MGNKEKKPLVLSIFDNKLKIVTDEDEEYVYKVVAFLNEKMEEISSKVKLASSNERMTLVALNVADEYFKLKKSSKETEYAEQDFTSIISVIDDALKSGI